MAAIDQESTLLDFNWIVVGSNGEVQISNGQVISTQGDFSEVVC
jgi:hypothetical protein